MARKLSDVLAGLQQNHPFCSQCGKRMKHYLGGWNKDIFIWECSQLVKGSRHDYYNAGYIDIDPIYDKKTGKKIE